MRLFARLLALAVAALAACGGGSPPPQPSATGLPVPLGSSPQRGPDDAWVTVVEFSDFQCSFCGEEFPVLEQTLAAHLADVRLVYKHFPLTARHANALGAAIAAECAADQGKFWELHDQLFAHQDALGPTQLPALARAAGVPDLAKWQACLGTPAPAARVDADVALAGQVGVQGTPTLFVNGAMYPGALDHDQLEAVVKAAQQQAEQSGIPRADYYAKAVLGQ